MIDAAPANVSNRMRKNQTADRHCSIKYVVARLQPAFGPGAKREPGRAKHEENKRGVKPRDYILDCEMHQH